MKRRANVGAPWERLRSSERIPVDMIEMLNEAGLNIAESGAVGMRDGSMLRVTGITTKQWTGERPTSVADLPKQSYLRYIYLTIQSNN